MRGESLISSHNQQGCWSPKSSTIPSAENHTPQATSNTSRLPWLYSQSDRGTPAGRPHEAGTTLPEDDSEAPRNAGRRRRRRKSRASRNEDSTDGIFSSQPNMIPLIPIPGVLSWLVQPWAYYPPPAFMVVMPLPVVPFVPMFGPSHTNINSGNVTNVNLCNAANNNSTNLRMKKGKDACFRQLSIVR
jgi:hypothetical protein